MTSKRRPGSQLTQDNWDDDEEHQEAGVFTPASAEALKGRQIKKAKRRAGLAADGSSGGNSAFKAFGGFSGFGATTSNSKPSFSFNAAPTQANGTKTESTTTSKTANDSGDPVTSRSQYLTSLKNLNESVTKWIRSHVEQNPFCILTPIFSDYEQHLKKLEVLDPDKSTGSSAASNTQQPVASTPVKEADIDSVASDGCDKDKDGKAVGTGLFGSAATAAASKPTTGFSFSTGSTLTSGSGLFGSGSTESGVKAGPTFSFATSKPVTNLAAASTDQQNEEEYVPPKEEVKKIEEKDAFYTKRCKLFFKKGESWQEKGVGNLHLKPCDGKTQLLIRADTNLGNILLNIMLTSSVPVSRQGKNNVMLVCVPNPPLEKPADADAAVSMLIRVKTGADADELHDKLREAKQQQQQQQDQ